MCAYPAFPKKLDSFPHYLIFIQRTFFLRVYALERYTAARLWFLPAKLEGLIAGIPSFFRSRWPADLAVQLREAFTTVEFGQGAGRGVEEGDCKDPFCTLKQLCPQLTVRFSNGLGFGCRER